MTAMSDLSLQLQQPSTLLPSTQLPVNSYFDEALYQREMDVLFKNGPRYVGHQLAVPNVGDYYTLPQESTPSCFLLTRRIELAELLTGSWVDGRRVEGCWS